MNKKGFTLVELLVALTILSVLSTLGFIIYYGILPRARDAKRVSDLNKLATALEVYYQRNGKYIDGTAGTEGGCINDAGDTNAFYDQISGIKNYITDDEVPLDPQKNSSNTYPKYCYVSAGDGKSYRLFAKLENCQTSGGNLCTSLNYNFSVFSNDLTLIEAPR